MCSTATETETSTWSRNASPAFSTLTLRASPADYNDYGVDDDDELFPSFDQAYIGGAQMQDFSSPVPAPAHGQPQQQQPKPSPRRSSHPLLESRLGEQLLISRDDTHLEDEPTRHVDYLTHPWNEEDVWCTWRHVVSKKSILTSAARLENASWRCWGKCRNGGLTVPPEKIDWLKDHDVLWLYGPLMSYTTPRQRHPASVCGMTSSLPQCPNASASSESTQSDSSPAHPNKKSILKRRTASQIILQRSLMTQTLIKHAAGILESRCDGYNEDATHSQRPSLSRQASDLSSRDSNSGLSMNSSTSSSTVSAATPTASKRHISFNNEVAQCIAVDCDTIDDEYSCDDGGYKGYGSAGFDKYFARGFESCILDDDEDQYDETIIDDEDDLAAESRGPTARPELDTSRATPLSNTTTPRSSFSSGKSNATATTNSTNLTNRTIQMLPPTTLKAPVDEIDTSEQTAAKLAPSNEAAPLSSSSLSSGMLHSLYPSWLPKIHLPSLVRSDSEETIKPSTHTELQQPRLDEGPEFMLDGEDTTADDQDISPRVGTFKWRQPSSPTSDSWSPPSQSTAFSYAGEENHKFSNSLGPISSDMFRPFDAFDDEEDYIEGRYIHSGVKRPSAFDHDLGDADHEHLSNYRLVDKVLDTVNTARDIAHVIWNVGWRS